MSRSVLLSFAALGLFLLALPALLFKPGLPLALRGDEGTYLGLAGSLLEDQDLAFSARDAERVFAQFPFDPEIEFRLRSAEKAEKGEKPSFDAPLLYPLLAVPALALLESNGLLVLNVALILAAMWLAMLFLQRRQLGSSALFLAAPFVLLSPAFLYAFWLRPSALLFLLGTLAFTEGWAEDKAEVRPLPAWRRMLAGVALGLAAAHLPFLLIFALPILARLRQSERARCVPYAAAVLAGFLVFVALHFSLLGSAFPGRDAAGKTYLLEKATDEPWLSPAGSSAASPATPALRPFTAERLLFSLIERRRGFLPYFPLAVLALFFWRAPRRREAPLLATLVLAIAVQPWVGELDPGLPMNPALLPLYPAFLLFVRSIPQLGVIAGSAIATFLLGLQWVGVLGSPIPEAGAHGHVRAFPFPYLPLDIEEVKAGSGMLRLELSGEDAPVMWAAADMAMLGGRELWTYGREKVELFLESRHPLADIVLQVRSVGAPNRIELRHQGGVELYEFASLPATSQRLIHLGAPEVTTQGTYIYRFEIRSDHGYKPYWTNESEGGDYIGAAITYLGTPEELARDLYAIEWQSCAFAAAYPAGSRGLALAEARNASGFAWPSRGASRVRFASRWLDSEGQLVLDNPLRSALLNPVPPGATVKTWLLLQTPPAPGRYQLEFDAVYENVAWFADRNGRKTCRQEVEITAKASP